MAEKEKVVKAKILNLDDFKKAMKKDFGKDSIVDATEKESYTDVIPLTSFSLNNAVGIGGFAKRKITVIDGESSGGKSTTAYDAIGQCQKKFGDTCLLIDKEDGFSKKYTGQLGVDVDKLLIANPRSLEDMYDVLLMAIESDLFGCIVVDSVTSFAPDSRFEGSVVLGVESRVNSDKMRLIADMMPRHNTSLILIQQIRSKIGAIGDPTTVSGGSAIPFYAHVRIRITRSKIDRELRQNIIKFTVIKNKMDEPYRVGTVVYKWGVGFDFFSEVAELAIEFGIIRNEKTSYFPPEVEDLKIIGKKKMIAYLTENPEYTKAVIQPLVLKYMEENGDLRSDEIDEDDLN